MLVFGVKLTSCSILIFLPEFRFYWIWFFPRLALTLLVGTLRLGVVGSSGSSQKQKLLTLRRSLCSVALYLLNLTEAASLRETGC